MQKRYGSIAILVITVALVISAFAWASLNRSNRQQVGQLKALARGDRDAPVFKSPRLPLANVTGTAGPAPVAKQYQYAVVTSAPVAQQYQYAAVTSALALQNLIPVTGENTQQIAQQYQYAVVEPAPVAQQYQYR